MQSPPVGVGLMNENEGIYYMMWGGFDRNDELHDDGVTRDRYKANDKPDGGNCG